MFSVCEHARPYRADMNRIQWGINEKRLGLARILIAEYLPKRLDLINTATSSWSTQSTVYRRGQNTFDLWLTKDALVRPGGFPNVNNNSSGHN